MMNHQYHTTCRHHSLGAQDAYVSQAMSMLFLFVLLNTYLHVDYQNHNNKKPPTPQIRVRLHK